MKLEKKPLIIISGPTASGKTSTSIRLAKRLQAYNVRIVNFDSLLFYKELNIGTAKPSMVERQGIAHSLIDVRSITDPLNAADFTTLALKILEQCYQNNELPILVGGSGFYLRALVKGMYDSIDVSENVRQESAKLYEENGIEPFIASLEINDPERMQRLHPNDHYRIKRAWEHWKMTGKPLAAGGQEHAGGDPYDFSQHRLEQWNLYHLHMDMPRAEHVKIIAERTAQMLRAGFINETQALLATGFSGKEKPLQSIGYKEILAFLDGQLDETLLPERIEATTRRLAKQQRTFFAKIRPKHVFHPIEDIAKLEASVVEWIEHQVKL